MTNQAGIQAPFLVSDLDGNKGIILMCSSDPEDRKYLDILRNMWFELIPRDPVTSCLLYWTVDFCDPGNKYILG